MAHPNDNDNDDIVVRDPDQNPVPLDLECPLGPPSYNFYRPNGKESPILFETLTEEQNENLTEEQLRGIQSDFPTVPRNLPPNWVRIIIRQISTPTGKWKDFNAVWEAYFQLRRMAKEGLFSMEALPPQPPDPADYADNS